VFDRRIGKLICPAQVGDPWWAFCFHTKNMKKDTLKSLLRVLGLGLFGFVTAWIASAGAPSDVVKEAIKWNVIFWVTIGILAETYREGYEAGKNSK